MIKLRTMISFTWLLWTTVLLLFPEEALADRQLFADKRDAIAYINTLEMAVKNTVWSYSGEYDIKYSSNCRIQFPTNLSMKFGQRTLRSIDVSLKILTTDNSREGGNFEVETSINRFCKWARVVLRRLFFAANRKFRLIDYNSDDSRRVAPGSPQGSSSE